MRPRQGDRRLIVDQRHDLFARPSPRLRPLGGERPAVVVLCPRAAVLQEAGDLGGRPERASRRRRPARHLLVDLRGPAGGGLYRGEPHRRAEMESRSQQRQQRGHRAEPEHHPRRPALQRGGGLSATGDAAAESHGRDPRAGVAHPARPQPRGRRRVPPRRRHPHGAGAARGAAGGRRDQLAANPDAVGHRRSRRAQRGWRQAGRWSCAASGATCRITSPR